jgi:glycosyltransferase involved in cell wall biosynthesis
MDEPWADVGRAADWLRDLERQVRPDIVHLNGYCHGAAGFSAPVIIVAHSCVLSWWEAVEKQPAPERYTTYKEAVKRGLTAADAVIAVSQAMRASLERHYGPLPRTAVVPNGLAPPAPRTAEKEEFILAAGRVWDRAKNVETLARVARQLPWPVKVAGGDSSVHDGVESLGWLPPEELGGVMHRASIFALPARYEPFGLTALEAALRGCALVLGDIPSQREVWGDAALYVQPDDEAALVETITKLTSDAEQRTRLAEAANLRAQLYTPERNARAMRDLYDAIIHARRAPSLPLQRPSETRSA